MKLPTYATLLFLCLNPIASAQNAFPEIQVELFDPNYPEGDSNYHCLTAASNGDLYFAINSHHSKGSVRIYRFDTKSEKIFLVSDVSADLGLDPDTQILHGKIHTPLFEWDGYLYFATHTSQYDGNLPMVSPPQGIAPYEGGHFMRLNLDTDEIEDLAHLSLPNEGIITMEIDREAGTLYGLTWPSGLLVSFNLEERLLKNWGSVQGRGEWGRVGEEWDFICRTLGMDGQGILYGSDDLGRIWKFEKNTQRPVSYYSNLSLDTVPTLQINAFEIKPEVHYFWRNWRTITWNATTESFWGLHGGSAQLFEFSPAKQSLRSVLQMIPSGVEAGRRNPMRTQLGFMLGPQNTLFYLAHGNPLSIDRRKAIKSSVHLLTYQIDEDKFTDHGILIGPDQRRVFFTESVEIGKDDHLYSIAWVESIDSKRMKQIQKARGGAVPEETKEVIYEIQLVRLPRWDQFVLGK